MIIRGIWRWPFSGHVGTWPVSGCSSEHHLGPVERYLQAQTQPIAISRHPVYEQRKEETLACEDPLHQPAAGRPPHSLSSRLLQKPGLSFRWLL